MPYIKPETDRKYIDDELAKFGIKIQDISKILREVPSGKVKGAVNYFCSRVDLQAMRPETGWGYTSISEAIAVLRDAADEIRRRLMDNREDIAIIINGDLPEFLE